MGPFLAQVSAAHPEDFIVMVVDGASSLVAKVLVVPENIRLHRLPAYAHELNPQEHVWDEIREKEFRSQTWRAWCKPCKPDCRGWRRITTGCAAFAAWPWIVNLNLNANWN